MVFVWIALIMASEDLEHRIGVKRCCAFEDRFEIAGSSGFDFENLGIRHAISFAIVNIIDPMCDVICNFKQDGSSIVDGLHGTPGVTSDFALLRLRRQLSRAEFAFVLLGRTGRCRHITGSNAARHRESQIEAFERVIEQS